MCLNNYVIEPEGGMVLRLLPNIDDNGLKQQPILSNLSLCHNSDMFNFSVNDDLNVPLFKEFRLTLLENGDENVINNNRIYKNNYMYVLDEDFNIKILKFDNVLLSIISDELLSNAKLLNPMCGRALYVCLNSVGYGLFDYANSKFIDVDKKSIGSSDDSVVSYLLNSRKISFEKYIDSTSWLNKNYRSDVINYVLSIDDENFGYLKKIIREDKINCLLSSSA